MPPIVVSPTPSCIDTPLTITTSVLSLATIAMSFAGACMSMARASKAAPKEARSLICELERLQARLVAASSTQGTSSQQSGAAEEARKEISTCLAMLPALYRVDKPEERVKAQRTIACWAWQVSWATCGGRRWMLKRVAYVRTLIVDIESMKAELLLRDISQYCRNLELCVANNNTGMDKVDNTKAI